MEESEIRGGGGGAADQLVVRVSVLGRGRPDLGSREREREITMLGPEIAEMGVWGCRTNASRPVRTAELIGCAGGKAE